MTAVHGDLETVEVLLRVSQARQQFGADGPDGITKGRGQRLALEPVTVCRALVPIPVEGMYGHDVVALPRGGVGRNRHYATSSKLPNSSV